LFIHYKFHYDSCLHVDHAYFIPASNEPAGLLFTEDIKFERRSLSNIELMSAEADKGCKFERRSLSNIELMSAEADKGCNGNPGSLLQGTRL